MSQPSESTPDRVSPLEIPILLFIRGLTFLTLVIGLLFGLHWYLGARLIDHAPLTAPWRRLLWTALFALFASIFVGFIGGRVLPRRLAHVVQWVGFLWMGAFGLLVTTLAALDAATALAAPLLGGVDLGGARALAVVALVVPALAWGVVAARRPALERITVEIPGLHPDLDGFRLLQLSDVHLGETLGRSFAARLVAQVNALEPDAVVITGDLVDGAVARARDELAPLGDLVSRHGTFVVTGNHEYYSGAASWMAEYARLGMRVLHNEHQVLSRGGGQLVLGGVPDVEGGRFAASHRPDAGLAFAGAPDGVPRVLLAHQPRFAARAASAGVSLMLSGHTHGGQMFPFMVFVRLQQPVVSGLHWISGVLTYTSRGTGYWGPPYRVGARGELTEITLRCAATR